MAFEDFMMFGLVSGLFPNPYQKDDSNKDDKIMDFEYNYEDYLDDYIKNL